MLKVDVKGFERFIKHMKTSEYKLPNGVYEFMNVEAKKLINDCKSASPYSTFKKRWFTKSKKGKNKASIWEGIFNKYPHLHLVNDGHRLIGHKPDKKYLGQVDGKHFLDKPVEQFEHQFEIDMDKFMEGLW